MDLVAGYGSSSSEDNNNNDDDNRRRTAGAAAGEGGSKDEEEGERGGGGGADNDNDYDDAVLPKPKPVVRRSDKSSLRAAPKPSLMASAAASTTTALVTARRGRAGATSTAPTSSSMVLLNNPLKSQLMKPIQGPTSNDPTGVNTQTSRGVLGIREDNVTFDDVTFDTERKLYQRTLKARAPDEHGTMVSSDVQTYHRRAGVTGNKDPAMVNKKRKLISAKNDQIILVTKGCHPEEDESRYGIWGPPSKSQLELQNDTLSDLASGKTLTSEQLAEREYLAEKARLKGLGEDDDTKEQQFDRLVERKMSHLLPPRLDGEEPIPCEATTKFHGKEEINYKGQSWIVPPSGVHGETKVTAAEDDSDGGGDGKGEGGEERDDTAEHKCYVPKKCIHRFTGHNKGVHRIRCFPSTGHLLLSGGLDGKCKVWSISQKQCMRTYIGHTAAVRDVQYNNDGTKFLSASFDRFIRLWDTESGKVLNTFTNRRVPYVVQFYPPNNHTFVVGCSDNKVVAYNTESGEITQEYNHHLAPVNTITFCENSTKMVTSSDDKKVLIWEWDIGVPIKYISDPMMHSIPVITKHPNNMYWLGQSLDNTIVVYQARDRFAIQRKKKFSGHTVAGYACDIAISPDGSYVCSGDGEGKVYFWEWKRQKLLQKYRAHDNGPTIGCAWHPLEPSTVFTCGWDGIIKMWK